MFLFLSISLSQNVNTFWINEITKINTLCFIWYVNRVEKEDGGSMLLHSTVQWWVVAWFLSYGPWTPVREINIKMIKTLDKLYLTDYLCKQLFMNWAVCIQNQKRCRELWWTVQTVNIQTDQGSKVQKQLDWL
jgi:hypothetical protein